MEDARLSSVISKTARGTCNLDSVLAPVPAPLSRKSGVIAVCFLGAVVGCANPGLPKPPSLRLPATVTDLSASRVGNRVELLWTAPSRTTDGLDIEEPTAVEICRDPTTEPGAVATNDVRHSKLSVAPAPCTTVLSIIGHSGASTAVAQMPPDLTGAGGQQVVAFRVRVLNSAGRSGPPSAPALVPGGAAPEPVTGFRAKQQKGGVLLRWTEANDEKASSAGDVEVVRTLKTSQPESQGKTAAKTPAPGKRSSRSRPSTVGRTQAEDASGSVRLQQAGGEALAANPVDRGLGKMLDGMVDQGAADGQTYTYVAQRVETLTREGMTLKMASEPTAPALVTVRDTFPPGAPRGLMSVPSPGRDNRGATLDLTWEPNSEMDLAGYLVYRAEAASGASAEGKQVRLTPTPIQGAAYRDAAVVGGHRYIYRVTAVDQHGNESKLSAPVTDTPDGR